MKRSLYKEKIGDFSVKLEVEEPKLYRVMLEKDAFTPGEFVLLMLETYFNVDRRMAVEIMQHAQQYGRAVCGLFSKDVAATKIAAVTECAVQNEFPLVCSMEAA